MVHVRLARPADLKSLATLCLAAVGPDDYVLEYLPEMIDHREIVVTAVAGRIQAMTGLTECADGALWIGQLRTHPNWRRRGLARMLLDHAYARVIREGRPGLRLWTSQRNIAARELFESNGFRRVTMFTRMVAQPLPGNRVPTIKLSGTRILLRRWDRSLFGTQGKGYLDYRWRFTRLNESIVRKLFASEELLANSRSAALAWTEDENYTDLHVAVLIGGKDGLLLARRIAGARQFSSVQAFLPRTRRSLTVARQAGFKAASWGTRAILYERPVPET